MAAGPRRLFEGPHCRRMRRPKGRAMAFTCRRRFPKPSGRAAGGRAPRPADRLSAASAPPPGSWSALPAPAAPPCPPVPAPTPILPMDAANRRSVDRPAPPGASSNGMRAASPAPVSADRGRTDSVPSRDAAPTRQVSTRRRPGAAAERMRAAVPRVDGARRPEARRFMWATRTGSRPTVPPGRGRDGDGRGLSPPRGAPVRRRPPPRSRRRPARGAGARAGPRGRAAAPRPRGSGGPAPRSAPG